MTKNPLVSVIIPLYNREKTISRAIESILKQSYQNYEIIVVDDCSKDSGAQIVEDFHNDKIRIIRLPENHGANYARNTGIQDAEGELIAFLDSDDEWMDHKLEKQIEYMQTNELDACFCSYTQVWNSGERRQIPNPELYPYENMERDICKILAVTNVVGTPALILSRKAIDDIGLFDVNMPKMQDYEFAIRLARKYKIGFVREPLWYAYIQNDSLTVQNSDAQAFMVMLRKYPDFLDKDVLVNRLINLGYFLENGKVDYQRIDEVENITRLDIKKKVLDVYAYEWSSKLAIQQKQYELFVSMLRNQEFVIYGAGLCGKKVLAELKKLGLEPKAFAVTKIGDTTQEVNGIPVIGIEDIKDRETKVIVATTSKYAVDMVSLLVDKGFTSFTVYPTRIT